MKAETGDFVFEWVLVVVLVSGFCHLTYTFLVASLSSLEDDECKSEGTGDGDNTC